MSDTRRSRWIPWTFVGMFGVIISVNLVMALIAFSSWTGLSARDPYKRGLIHNRLQADVVRQDRLGWKIGVGHEALGAGRTRLRITIQDATQRQVDGARIDVILVRPVSQGQDFNTRLKPVGNGVYEARVNFPSRGLWEARFRIVARGLTLRASRRMKVR